MNAPSRITVILASLGLALAMPSASGMASESMLKPVSASALEKLLAFRSGSDFVRTRRAR